MPKPQLGNQKKAYPKRAWNRNRLCAHARGRYVYFCSTRKSCLHTLEQLFEKNTYILTRKHLI